MSAKFSPVEEFTRWQMTAQPGDVITYHQGNLMADKISAEVRAVGSAAWAAYERGLVELVQKRVGEGCCAYIAIARKVMAS